MNTDRPNKPPTTCRATGLGDEQNMDEEALRENFRKLSALLNSAVDAIITIDAQGIIDSVNPATHTMFGYTEDELVGQTVSVLMPEPYHSEHDNYLSRYQETGEKKVIGIGREVTARHKDGSVFPIQLTVSEFLDGDGLMFTGIIHDITKRRELEHHLAEIRIKEQQRVAQELHDGLGGQMTGIALLVKALKNRLEAEGSNHALQAAELARHIDNAHIQLRAISRGLSPVEVMPDGLSHALALLAAQTDKADGVHCTFESASTVIQDSTIVMNLYRVAQEAVSNAIRHGHPDQIDIRLDQDNDHLILTISNNGKSIQHLSDTGRGMGIRTMQHRSDMMGGTLRVTSAKGGGTIVTCRVPNQAKSSTREVSHDKSAGKN